MLVNVPIVIYHTGAGFPVPLLDEYFSDTDSMRIINAEYGVTGRIYVFYCKVIVDCNKLKPENLSETIIFKKENVLATISSVDGADITDAHSVFKG
jgi:hypothetical protein